MKEMKENMPPLTEDNLESANGGFLYKNEDNKYEVIEDKTGETLAVFDTPDNAVIYARSQGLYIHPLTKEELEKLRNGELY